MKRLSVRSVSFFLSASSFRLADPLFCTFAFAGGRPRRSQIPRHQSLGTDVQLQLLREDGYVPGQSPFSLFLSRRGLRADFLANGCDAGTIPSSILHQTSCSDRLRGVVQGTGGEDQGVRDGLLGKDAFESSCFVLVSSCGLVSGYSFFFLSSTSYPSVISFLLFFLWCRCDTSLFLSLLPQRVSRRPLKSSRRLGSHLQISLSCDSGEEGS